MASTSSQAPLARDGLFNHGAGRWLWFSGFGDAANFDVKGLIEKQRGRTALTESAGACGTIDVKSYTGGAWAHFSSPAFAQHCMSTLNGFTPATNAPMLRVRYAGDVEDTSRAPQVRYVKRLRSEAAPTPAAGRGQAAGGSKAVVADPSSTSDAKRIKIDASSAAPAAKQQGRSSPSLNASLGGGATPTAAAASGSGGGGGGAVSDWAGGTGTTADVLRLALGKLDIDVALAEILYFLTHDERLPGRTRKAVQFLHGLRECMVQGEAHKSKPELFDCPLASNAVTDYTFKEVRQRYGDKFRDTFWPVFQAFNCVLPSHAPEEPGARSMASAMLPQAE